MATIQMKVRPEDLSQVPKSAERIPEPGILVIFGASGDLTKRKLLPALFHLRQANLLPKQFAIVGVARRPLGDEFAADMREGIVEFGAADASDPKLDEFLSHISYFPLKFDDPSNYAGLKAELERIDREKGIAGNRLFYLATAPEFFAGIIENLGAQGMANPEKGVAEIVIEKPFGHDLDSARLLNHQVNAVFHENQVFRIDHYLGKETVQNLLVFRFANGIFEPIWNRRYIDHVQITVAETLGVEGRGSYYEETGALRDIIQNHVMQLAAIIGMEPPSNFEAETVRDEKVKLLRAIRPIHPDDALLHTIRGQYASGAVDGTPVPGYREELGVDAESLRETFVAMKLDIDNWRWAGTPFYLRTGKRLPSRATEIAIQFRRVPHSPFAGHRAMPGGMPPPDGIAPNQLLLRIQPDEGITLRFGAKVPGQAMRIESVNMDFFYGSSFQRVSPDAYERLLLDCMLGDATLFAREDEVEEAWRVCTAILDGWRAHPPDRIHCPNYEAGTWGPTEADDFMSRDGREWRRP